MPNSPRNFPMLAFSPPRRFWQLQLAGWTAVSLFALPLKVVFFESLGASLLLRAYQLPLEIGCSTVLHWIYLGSQAERRRSSWAAIIVLASALAVSGADLLISVPMNRVLGLTRQPDLPWPGLFAFRVAIYLIWSLGYLLLKAQMRSRAQAFQLAVNDERHRLELLRYQLNPNFLSKTLATIAHQVSVNPATARTMITRLGDFYQNTLRHTERGQPTTIGDEVAMLRAYLDIEQLRLRDTLEVRYEVDENLLSLALPPVLLLPLAERAILSAGGTAERPLEITVSVRRGPQGFVQLELSHTGRLDPTQPAFEAIEEPGWASLRASLERHYAGRYRFNLSQDSFHVRATLSLPLAG